MSAHRFLAKKIRLRGAQRTAPRTFLYAGQVIAERRSRWNFGDSHK